MNSNDKGLIIIVGVIVLGIVIAMVSSDIRYTNITQMYANKGYVECINPRGDNIWLPKNSCPTGVINYK